MPLPRVPLRSFLSQARKALNVAVQDSSPATFVVGNESADLDSLCSAVVLAYLRTYTSSSKNKQIYIPLSNLPRADLSLRPELVPVLSHAHLKPGDLITLSDLPTPAQLPKRLKPENTKWILVDHNALTGDLAKAYSNQLAGVLDHHDEENKVPKDCGDEPRIVKKSGSCSSLVIDYCKDAWRNLPLDEASKAIDSEIARIALAPILIDTVGLKTKFGKATAVDFSSSAFLEAIVKQSSPNYNREEYFKEVDETKKNIDDLSLVDIFRKDYKQWTEGDSLSLGMSSVVRDMKFLIDKAGSKEALFDIYRGFAKERGLSICAIMTASSSSGKFKRELLVWALNEKAVPAAKKFEQEAIEVFELKEWEEGELDFTDEEMKERRRCWWQQKLDLSRKQVGPMLRKAMA